MDTIGHTILFWGVAVGLVLLGCRRLSSHLESLNEDDRESLRSCIVVVGGIAGVIGGIYGLIKFVKWAWYH